MEKENRMDDNIKPWLAAHDLLFGNPDARASCPECKTGALNLKETQIDENKIDRTISCDSCGKQKVFTIEEVTIEEIRDDPFDEMD